MFYVAEALLLERNLSFSRHSAVIAAFGQHFTKPGLVPSTFQRYLTEGESLRHLGDYGQRSSVDADRAVEQVRRAEELLKVAQQMLKFSPPTPGPTGLSHIKKIECIE